MWLENETGHHVYSNELNVLVVIRPKTADRPMWRFSVGNERLTVDHSASLDEVKRLALTVLKTKLLSLAASL